MSAPDDTVTCVIAARRDRLLGRARKVARTPDMRTGDELLEAADFLERYGDRADSGLAIEARRAALHEEGFRRIAALCYLHRRRVRLLISVCWALSLVALLCLGLLAATHLFHP